MQTSTGLLFSLLFVTSVAAFAPRPELSMSATGKVCEICEVVVKVTAGLLNLDQSQIEAELDKECTNLGPLAGVCKMVVNAFLPQMIKYLNEGNTPEQVCEKLKLCTSTQQNHFINKITFKSSGAICPICEMLVKMVAGLANMDENQIKQKLDDECTQLGPLASMCKGIVDAYLPKIIEYLNSGNSADLICAKMGLCPASIFLKKKSVQPKPKGLTCTLCQTLVEATVQFLNQSEGQIQQDMDGFCNSLGSPLSSVCKQMIDTYLPKIVEYLNQGKNATWICQDIDLCASIQMAVQAQEAKKVVEKQPKGITCTLCQTLVEATVQFLNQSEGQIQQDMDGFCNSLGSPLSSVCKQLIDTYLPKIVEYLNQGKNATWICQDIDLCDSIQMAIQEAKMKAEKRAKGVSCTICEVVVQEAASLLNLTEPEIASKLKEVCKKLGFLESACDDMVDKYLPDIVKYLQSGNTADEVCNKLGLCSKEMHLRRSEILRPQPRGLSCTLCEKLVQVVDKILAMDEPQIEAYVKKECSLLGPLASQCTNIVDSYLEKIISELNNGTAAEQVCTNLGLCSGAAVQQKKTKNAQDCSICKAMGQLAVNLLNQGMSQSDIKTRLETECNKFGSTADKCRSIIDSNFQQFMGYLQGGMTPAQLCSKLGYC